MKSRAMRKLMSVTVAIGLVAAWPFAAAADDLSNNVNTLVNGADNKITMSVGDAATIVGITLTASGGQGETDPIPTCNLNGDAHTLVVNAISSNTAVATVAPNPLTFTDCDTQNLSVTPVEVGTSNVTFTINEALSNVINPSAFALSADFTVEVDDGSDGVCDGTASDPDCVPVEVCERPAAPAWAAHILKSSSTKKKQFNVANYVSMVAGHMGPGTDFGTAAKTDDPAYQEAVLAYLQEVTTNTALELPSTWPPDECHTEYVLG